MLCFHESPVTHRQIFTGNDVTDEKELVQIFAIFFKPSLFVLAMVNDLSVNRIFVSCQQRAPTEEQSY